MNWFHRAPTQTAAAEPPCERAEVPKKPACHHKFVFLRHQRRRDWSPQTRLYTGRTIFEDVYFCEKCLEYKTVETDPFYWGL